jgi:hypothetical protein
VGGSWGSRGFTADQYVFDGGVGKETLKVWANIGLESGGGVLFNALEERGEEPLGVEDRGNFGHDGGMGKRCVLLVMLKRCLCMFAGILQRHSRSDIPTC